MKYIERSSGSSNLALIPEGPLISGTADCLFKHKIGQHIRYN